MISKELVIIWLSLQLLVTTSLWIKAEKKVSYLEGRQSVYDDFAKMEPDPPYTGVETTEHRLQRLKNVR